MLSCLHVSAFVCVVAVYVSINACVCEIMLDCVLVTLPEAW